MGSLVKSWGGEGDGVGVFEDEDLGDELMGVEEIGWYCDDTGECWCVSDVVDVWWFVDGDDEEGETVLEEVEVVVEEDVEGWGRKDGVGEWCVGIGVSGDGEGVGVDEEGGGWGFVCLSEAEQVDEEFGCLGGRGRRL